MVLPVVAKDFLGLRWYRLAEKGVINDGFQTGRIDMFFAVLSPHFLVYRDFTGK
ncbi:MAG TPA: hypothetical protein VMF87_07960 [Streptosporangiaceae bacterium]|nr:hypothetical protein [Streptosporangiaceae bacterium]